MLELALLFAALPVIAAGSVPSHHQPGGCGAGAMENRPDLRRLRPLTGTAAGRKLTVRVERLRYGDVALEEATALVRQTLAAGRPGIPPAADIRDEDACCGPRIGFDGRELRPPRGAITGLDTGGNGGTGFPSATLP